jgi:hypothetical protein
MAAGCTSSGAVFQHTRVETPLSVADVWHRPLESETPNVRVPTGEKNNPEDELSKFQTFVMVL